MIGSTLSMDRVGHVERSPKDEHNDNTRVWRLGLFSGNAALNNAIVLCALVSRVHGLILRVGGVVVLGLAEESVLLLWV